MARITIPEQLKGKELFKFLMQHKDMLIAQKKSLPVKYAEAFTCSPDINFMKAGVMTKAATTEELPENVDLLKVTIVANAANWCDSHMDVLIPGCWQKSIQERAGLIPHLRDHKHEIGSDAELGDVQDIYSKDIKLRDLGLDLAGRTQCLIFETDIRKSYNERMFNKYKAGKVKQHSIGLQYVKIGMAINDADYVAQYELWNKYYASIINKDVVDDKGYFWAVPEIRLLEVSAVLFGSNELTPTLDVKSTELNPPSGSSKQPPTIAKSVDFSAFIN